jgi:hypothetical protein
VKIAGKKNVAALKTGTMPKGVGATSLKVVSALLKAVPKAGTPPKAAAPTDAAAKSVPPTAPSVVSGAGMTKAVTMGQQGAQGTMKTGVLKIKAGQRKATTVEPSLTLTTKKAKFVLVSSSAPAPAHNVVAPVLPVGGSDDD